MEDNESNYNFVNLSDVLKQVDNNSDNIDSIDRYYNNTITEY